MRCAHEVINSAHPPVLSKRVSFRAEGDSTRGWHSLENRSHSSNIIWVHGAPAVEWAVEPWSRPHPVSHADRSGLSRDDGLPRGPELRCARRRAAAPSTLPPELRCRQAHRTLQVRIHQKKRVSDVYPGTVLYRRIRDFMVIRYIL